MQIIISDHANKLQEKEKLATDGNESDLYLSLDASETGMNDDDNEKFKVLFQNLFGDSFTLVTPIGSPQVETVKVSIPIAIAQPVLDMLARKEDQPTAQPVEIPQPIKTI